MVNHGIGAKHPVSNGSSNDESAGSNGNVNTNTNNMSTDFNKIRRESLDAESAEKALREVQKALSGLGVATTVES
jgi:predicted aconitase